MDYLHSCYQATARVSADPSIPPVTLRWYWAPSGAKPFPGRHAFGSNVWETNARDYPTVAPTLGEVDLARKWDKGLAPPGVTGLSLGTPAEWFLTGVPSPADLATIVTECGSPAFWCGWAITPSHTRWRVHFTQQGGSNIWGADRLLTYSPSTDQFSGSWAFPSVVTVWLVRLVCGGVPFLQVLRLGGPFGPGPLVPCGFVHGPPAKWSCHYGPFTVGGASLNFDAVGTREPV